MSTNKLNSIAIAAALAGAVSMVALASPASDAFAASKLKCYGISKAGENDCANAAGTHSCAGHSTVNFDGGEWKVAKSKDACDMAGGALKPFEGPNPKKVKA